MNVYEDKPENDFFIREFSENVDSNELVWHRDKKSRVIIPIQCEGWFFQKDNEPPEELIPNVSIFIEAERYHRIIKGSGPLILKILED